MQRDLGRAHTPSRRVDSPYLEPDLDIDVLCIGAGFAGCYLLHALRKAGFRTKIVEAGSDFGGVWHWNSYPGARVDSQWPIYALGIPEIYENWSWSEHYPGHEELKRYFRFVGEKLDLRKDTEFGRKVVSAEWIEDGSMQGWSVRCEDGFLIHCKFLIAGIGFAAKRYFPPWPGLDTFRGVMHHSSFWPQEGVDVRGKKVAVIGTGATGVQIIQEWAQEIGEEGSLVSFQRTPNTCCPMRQKRISKEEDEQMRTRLAEVFKERLTHEGGFLYSSKDFNMDAHTEEEREKFFEELWEMGGFRYFSNSYGDLLLNQKTNDAAYDFWARKTRARINDPRKRDLLAPASPLHVFCGKRPSLEQTYYDQFNKPNVDVLNVRTNPIDDILPEGIRTADGVVHEFDVIALATGFDAVSGGLNDIDISGSRGELLRDKWANGIFTNLGMTSSSFPNFFFLYGPQGPTAHSNGPSCVEPQADWIVSTLMSMRDGGKTRIDAEPGAELEWKKLVLEKSANSLRNKTLSSYNGGNIPGKVVEPLSYAGGLPDYLRRIEEVRAQGMKGFHVT